jgi:hypothetical protein
MMSIVRLWRRRRASKRRQAITQYQCGVDWAILLKEAGAATGDIQKETAHLPPDDPFRRGATSVLWRPPYRCVTAVKNGRLTTLEAIRGDVADE